MAPQLSSISPLQNVGVETLIAAVESSRSPLILTDYLRDDNPIIYSNQAFLELTGYDMDDVIGHNCRFLQGEDTDQDTIAELRDAVKYSKSVRVTLKNYKKDGTPFWNDLLMSPITDASGKTTHFLGMQLDITERIETQNSLRAKTAELEASNKELEQFTYATSHDLQEPLRMISSYLQLITKRYGDKLDNDGHTFLGYATEGAERMQTLIYDLLSLSKITTTKDSFKQIAMEQVVERALFNLKLVIEESHADIRIETLPEVRVDVVQMTQLFQNLISNAIKYRQPDVRPIVTISAQEQRDRYVFSVSDNGIGIPKKQFKRIFFVFQRLHTHAEYEGTGIGLAICGKIVDRHGGTIWVESEEGKGSTFKFSLPKNEGSVQ